MKITPYHAKYYAFELTKRYPSDSIQKLSATLADAQVDLNPHQIDAALFAFKSPLSKGAILADEVGLGKTIEAGLVLAQKWAEGKRRLLIIVPSNLRKQWSVELDEKFFLPNLILETKNFNQFVKKGIRNPFSQNNLIIICSFQFAKKHSTIIKNGKWDLVVLDEAHRLRNVYRTDNKIGRILKESLADFNKILLTATPLQNSLLELFGLVSIIDETIFGELKSYKAQFVRLNEDENFNDLRARINPICKRTLRKQVREYVPYTNRSAITIDFYPTAEEVELYNLVGKYLQRDLLYALPASQRHLMTLILRKLLASSTFAIAGTLTGLVKKLEKVVTSAEKISPASLEEEIGGEYEAYQSTLEEWNDENGTDESVLLSEQEIEVIKGEIEELKQYRDLAISIPHNAKGTQLIPAIEQGFIKARELGAIPKALIFTESTRTQNYLFELLSTSNYKAVLFNGSNNDSLSKEIYHNWVDKNKGSDKVTGSKTADIRAALVDYFRHDADIMIATEAAAEGINLQFCNLVINYDLPWNPQRIEQRIGRCHRYGQRFDVVVVNFLNRKNAADVRVYQLLDEKFKLFDGVFGASDDVLGAIESGVDFEKRIGEIYQECRTEQQIQIAFDELQKELEEQITDRVKTTRQKLLENFDDEVREKLRFTDDKSKENLSRYEQIFWKITQWFLTDHAIFEKTGYEFNLKSNPFPHLEIPLGPYKIGKNIEEAHIYRPGHPLAQSIFKSIHENNPGIQEVAFDLSGHKGKVSILDELINKKGYITAKILEVQTFETTDNLILTGIIEDGKVINEDQCQRLFSLSAQTNNAQTTIPDRFVKDLEKQVKKEKNKILEIIKEKDSKYFLEEVDKLTKWADDQILSAENEIKETKTRIKELNRQSKVIVEPSEQLKIQKELQDLSHKQRKQRQRIFEVEDEIDANRKKMIEEIEVRMKQSINEKELFLIKWVIV